MAKGKRTYIGYVEEKPGTSQVSTMSFGHFGPKKSSEQAEKPKPETAAHHLVWYDCCCVEAGSILDIGDTRTWCSDQEVLSVIQRAAEKCAGLVDAEAAVISGFEETLDFYAPYTSQLVHLAFPMHEFKTMGAAQEFLSGALSSDDPEDVLRPYLRLSSRSVFTIAKDSETGEASASEDEGDGDEAFSGFIETFQS